MDTLKACGFVMGMLFGATHVHAQSETSLKQERVNLLAEVVEAERGAHKFGLRSLSDVYQAELRLFNAKLSLVEEPSEKEVLYLEMIEITISLLRRAEDLFSVGEVTKAEVKKAEVWLLDNRIGLDELRADTPERQGG
jgi:outer membrane protein TolC